MNDVTNMWQGWVVAYQFQLDEPSLLKGKWMRMHWAERRRYTKRLSWLVLQAIKQKPETALQKAWVHVERGSYSVPADPDGVIGGMSALLDILTKPRGLKKYGFGLIEDDSPKHMKLTAHSVRTRQGQGYTKVTIYQPKGYQASC